MATTSDITAPDGEHALRTTLGNGEELILDESRRFPRHHGRDAVDQVVNQASRLEDAEQRE
jgi:hypothetical protein